MSAVLAVGIAFLPFTVNVLLFTALGLLLYECDAS